jgi:hypothetical protein
MANVQGCGQEFTLDSAPRYVTDNIVIEALRADILDKRSKLDRCHQSAVHWEAARSMSIPIVTIQAKNQRNSCDSLLSESVDTSSVLELLRTLLDASKLSHYLLVLPDLIEVSSLYTCVACSAREAHVAHTRF